MFLSLKKIITGLLFVSSAIAIAGFTRSDDDPVAKIVAQLTTWLSDHPQEKVYLQLDKPYYAVGDYIWFKAYVVAGSNHKPSAISGILNVELVDDKDSINQSLKLPVFRGLIWSDFELSNHLKEGNYHIRAYTNWMRNAGDEYFFNKSIIIVNPIANTVFTKANYSVAMQNGQQFIKGGIVYTNIDGTPYAGAPVNYSVIIGNANVFTGKGVTDEKGNLDIGFVNPIKTPLTIGHIITSIKLAGDKKVTKSIILKVVSDKVDTRFFPEGGSLVNGNETKMAFKSVGSDGIGVDVKGVIVDDRNKQQAEFSSTHLGMGQFTFTPKNGRTYKAELTYSNGTLSTIDLPVANNIGYTLNIDNSNEQFITIKVNAAAGQQGSFNLIAQQGGKVYYAAKSNQGNNSFTTAIRKNKFPSGIVQFTLFSQTGEPLNERVIFVQNPDQLKLNITSENQNYIQRQKVKIELNAKDKDDKPVVGSFSVSVTNESNMPVDVQADNTILSNLLLTSDIKGYIEKPGYYFNNINDKTKADLDLLMLTQGYRRFEWKQIIANSYPEIAYQPEKTLQISGHIKTMHGKPVPYGKVSLFSTKSGLFMIDTVADEQGRFVFSNLLFGDSAKVMVQARTAKNGDNVQLQLDTVMRQRTPGNKYFPDLQVNIYDGIGLFLKNSKSFYDDQVKYGIISQSIALKEVVINEKKAPKIAPDYLNGEGGAEQVVIAEELRKLPCAGQLEQCLAEILHFVTYANGELYSNREANALGLGAPIPMLILIDGFPSNAVALNNLDVRSIESIRMIGATGMYGAGFSGGSSGADAFQAASAAKSEIQPAGGSSSGSTITPAKVSIGLSEGAGGNGAGGVLQVTTIKGNSDYDLQYQSPDKIAYRPKGYSKVREFYSPQYDNPKTNAEISDLRSTIYWKPNIVTDENGKASFTYFNANTKGTYRVIIEGIDADGNLGRQVYRYVVQ